MYRVSGGVVSVRKWHFMTSCESESDYTEASTIFLILRAAETVCFVSSRSFDCSKINDERLYLR